MKIYLISDGLTQKSLSLEQTEISFNWFYLSHLKQSFLLVESAWLGYKNRWKYKIASYPDYPERTNEKLVRLVEKAKKRGIPTVFWNKEDGVHFDRFIDSARHFDHIFTVDANCVERYRAVVPASTTVDVAMFPVQPRIHNYQGVNFKHMEANFVGSYNLHAVRRERQAMLFAAAHEAGLPVNVFDRHSDSHISNYRYPEHEYGLRIHPAVSYSETANVYRDYLVSLNVNTVEDSPTMFSRRVVEVLACGGILVSTPSVSMEQIFKEYCHIVYSQEEAVELFARLKHGPTKQDLEMARAGSDFVLNHFTWKQFLQKIQDTIEANRG
ncbi:glycosyltransferase [Moraxella canis]|uniref:Glycosyltransferase n=1 Tax=Moraxella canis TaxID=90239 RepID=A0ABZ0X0H7_9GAMM|nr:glycosyltransferase [Moraxella canis]WQE04820.1 glycosyltransferase [Moraxella canis]